MISNDQNVSLQQEEIIYQFFLCFIVYVAQVENIAVIDGSSSTRLSLEDPDIGVEQRSRRRS